MQPSAAGRPKPFIPGDVARLEKALLNVRHVHSQALGVPIVMANRVGKLEGRLPGVMGYLKSSFLGGSYISDSDGCVLSALEQEEGVIISQVVLDPKYKAKTKPKRYGKIWAIPMPWYGFIYPMTQPWGEKAYKKSQTRKEKAWLKFQENN
ncbi:MAG: hypothetical protein GXP21_02270 [Gammaproteobacteria bacterium]|nr:hypothetical protein [Gammaproteobacteria bacterium]